MKNNHHLDGSTFRDEIQKHLVLTLCNIKLVAVEGKFLAIYT